jgi:hypothetical protein
MGHQKGNFPAAPWLYCDARSLGKSATFWGRRSLLGNWKRSTVVLVTGTFVGSLGGKSKNLHHVWRVTFESNYETCMPNNTRVQYYHVRLEAHGTWTRY